MQTISIRGSMSIGDGAGCGCSSSGDTGPIGFGGSGCGCCDGGSMSYDSVVPWQVAIATPGVIGGSFVDLPPLQQFTGIEFLRLVSSARVRIRINPTRPIVTGAVPLPTTGVQSGSMDIGVVGLDGSTYGATVVFSPATNTPTLVVRAINAAIAGQGAPFPPDGPIARLSTAGQLVLVSPGIGPDAALDIAAGAPAALGLGTVAVHVQGTSSDLPDTEGLVLLQFPRSGSPTKIQVSGTAILDIVAAGRVTA